MGRMANNNQIILKEREIAPIQKLIITGEREREERVIADATINHNRERKGERDCARAICNNKQRTERGRERERAREG